MKLLITVNTLEEEIGNIIMPLFDPATTLQQFREHMNAIALLIEENDTYEVNNYLKKHAKRGTKEETISTAVRLISTAYNEAY